MERAFNIAVPLRVRRRVMLLVLVLALALGACGRIGNPYVRSDGTDRKLTQELTDAFKGAADNGTAIDLGWVVAGPWTRLAFVCPYEDERVAEETLGFQWKGFLGEDDTEGRALFVFASDGAVLKWTGISREHGDPCGASPQLPRSTTRSDATFRVLATEPGFLTLAPVKIN